MATSMRVEITIDYHKVDSGRTFAKDATMQIPTAVRWLARYMSPGDSVLAGEILYALMYERNAVALRAIEQLRNWASAGSEAKIETFRDIRTKQYHLSIIVTEVGGAEIPPTPDPLPTQTPEPPTPQPRRLNFRGLKSISTDDSKSR